MHEGVALDTVEIALNYVKFLNVDSKFHEVVRGESRLWHSRQRQKTEIPHLPEILKRYHSVLLAAEIEIVEGVLKTCENLRYENNNKETMSTLISPI